MSARFAFGPTLTVIVSALTAAAAHVPHQPRSDGAAVLLREDFEDGLDRWELIGSGTARLAASGDARHNTVLELAPNGDAAVLIRGSDRWPRVRLEGEMRFPTEDESYLGLVYAHTARAGRQDFGLIYVKGDDSYLQVNPHRDFNVSRL